MHKTKPSTKAQEWARRRNFRKFQLDGILSTLKTMAHDKILTDLQRYDINFAIQYLAGTAKRWKAHNKKSKDLFVK